MKRTKAVVVNLCSIVFLLLFDAVQEFQQTLIFLDWTDRNSRLRGPLDGGELDRLSGDESVKREVCLRFLRSLLVQMS